MAELSGYVLNHWLVPYFIELLLEVVKLSPKYVLSFVESLNKKLQTGQMDILVRYWDYEKTIATTRYLNSEFMGEANANQILGSFIKGSKKLNESHILQISSDRPNVNLKFLKLYAEKQELDELSCLVDLGTCILHTIHGSLKNGISVQDGILGNYLKLYSSY